MQLAPVFCILTCVSRPQIRMSFRVIMNAPPPLKSQVQLNKCNLISHLFSVPLLILFSATFSKSCDIVEGRVDTVSHNTYINGLEKYLLETTSTNRRRNWLATRGKRITVVPGQGCLLGGSLQGYHKDWPGASECPHFMQRFLNRSLFVVLNLSSL